MFKALKVAILPWSECLSTRQIDTNCVTDLEEDFVSGNQGRENCVAGTVACDMTDQMLQGLLRSEVG